MRKHFAAYYRPSANALERLNTEALVSVDANVLLNLYRYSTETRDEFIALLERLASRLWLTHQAAQEFQGNRLNVVSTQMRILGDLSLQLGKARALLDPKLTELISVAIQGVEGSLARGHQSLGRSGKLHRGPKAGGHPADLTVVRRSRSGARSRTCSMAESAMPMRPRTTRNGWRKESTASTSRSRPAMRTQARAERLSSEIGFSGDSCSIMPRPVRCPSSWSRMTRRMIGG